jgi:hypothetical protein
MIYIYFSMSEGNLFALITCNHNKNVSYTESIHIEEGLKVNYPFDIYHRGDTFIIDTIRIPICYDIEMVQSIRFHCGDLNLTISLKTIKQLGYLYHDESYHVISNVFDLFFLHLDFYGFPVVSLFYHECNFLIEGKSDIKYDLLLRWFFFKMDDNRLIAKSQHYYLTYKIIEIPSQHNENENEIVSKPTTSDLPKLDVQGTTIVNGFICQSENIGEMLKIFDQSSLYSIHNMHMILFKEPCLFKNLKYKPEKVFWIQTTPIFIYKGMIGVLDCAKHI